MLKGFLSTSLSVLIIIGFTIVIQTKTAHAYIDLGTGSLMLQMLLGGFFASLFAVKVFWKRITTRMYSIFSKLGLYKPSPETTQNRYEEEN